MSKSIKEINSKLRELNDKYKESGLTDGKISLSAVASIQGKKNHKSGHLSKIGLIGGKVSGNRNVKNGHIDKLNSVSSKKRSERRKKQFDKQFVIDIMNKYPFNKDRAIALDVTEVTLRRILKDLKLYKKESSAEKMMRVYSDEQRSKLLNSHKNK